MVNIALGMLQHVVPLLIACVLGVTGLAEIEPYENVWVVRSTSESVIWSGLTYGSFIFVQTNETLSSLKAFSELDNLMLQHEYGHVIQQRILNEWYLPLIAIPSFTSAAFFNSIHRKTPWEIWANQLSGYDISEQGFFFWKLGRERFLNIRNTEERLKNKELRRLFESSQRAY